MEPVLVMKFGGTSLADLPGVRRAAAVAALRRRQGHRVVVVVSARARLTDRFIREAREAASRPEPREVDMLLSSGERLSAALFSITLNGMGVPALSLTGSQAGIITDDRHTNARIIEVRPHRVRTALEEGKIAVVGGFQGVSFRKNVTTLGRGGSDTSAVALAAALNAVRCEIYSDVDGVYSADPRLADDAHRIPEISYQEMQELAEAGARVLHPQSVEFAKLKGTILYARSSGAPDNPGTVIANLEGRIRPRVVGVASEEKVTLLGLQTPSAETPSRFLQMCEQHQLKTKQLSLIRRADGWVHLSLVVPEKENYHLDAALRELEFRLGDALQIRHRGSAVSMIGAGITERHETLLEAEALLRRHDLETWACHTSSFRISWIVPRKRLKAAVRLLHNEFCEAE